MSVTLAKAPRSFTVLMQDGTVHAVLITPATQEDRDLLYFDAYWGDCLDVCEVTAVDRYAAHIAALARRARDNAFVEYAAYIGCGEDLIRHIYTGYLDWAAALTPETRAAWHADLRLHATALRRHALIEVMCANREL